MLRSHPMTDGGALSNLLQPALLFFLLGVGAGWARSNLEIPSQITKFLSLYLLMAIGFKGGQAIAEGDLGREGLLLVVAAILLALAIPAWSFLILWRRVPPFDAAAISATYGSVSAVTFVAASQVVAARGDATTGAATVALVLMESPAIVMAVLLASWVRARNPEPVPTGGPAAVAVDTVVPDPPQGRSTTDMSIRSILHESLTDGAQILLIGSLAIGAIAGEAHGERLAPFTEGLFDGMLAFFLLEMGLLVARGLREARDMTPFLAGFALIMPIVHALVALAIGRLIGVTEGDAVLLTVLAASASYIVVPAVVRYAIPEARPSLYFTMALGVTFPFNLLFGIPLYVGLADRLWA